MSSLDLFLESHVGFWKCNDNAGSLRHGNCPIVELNNISNLAVVHFAARQLVL
jgi:hypothetical protein